MSTISTHVLDTSRGAPASGVAVCLEIQNTDESWTELSHAWTDTDGRVKPFFLVDRPVSNGTYRLVFDTEPYFSSLSVSCFYPQVTVVFNVDDGSQHYHVPLLISPYGYSTYRGSYYFVLCSLCFVESGIRKTKHKEPSSKYKIDDPRPNS